VLDVCTVKDCWALENAFEYGYKACEKLGIFSRPDELVQRVSNVCGDLKFGFDIYTGLE